MLSLLKLCIPKCIQYELITYDNRNNEAGYLYPRDIYDNHIEPDIDELKWYDNTYCLEAVKQDGCALIYVKEQTDEMCLEAVKENGCTLMFVKKQTPKICSEAVKRNRYALQYDKNITDNRFDSKLYELIKYIKNIFLIYKKYFLNI